MAFINKNISQYNISEPSLNILEKAEKMLKAKKEQVEQVKYELELVETDAYIKYKNNISYDFTFGFNSKVLRKAWQWGSMLEKGKDNDGKPIDKRKKYEEKTAYETVFDEIKKQFGRDDIKIKEILMFAYGQAYDIEFSTSGYNFQLTVPVIGMVSLDSYQHYSAEAFKLKLYYERVSSCWDWIGSTFEEEKLKDILDKWIHDKKEQELIDKLTQKEEK